MNRKLRWMCFWILLGFGSSALAGARPRPWASMLLSGYVDINPDGGVREYALDNPGKIPPVVQGVIKQAVQGWRFKVDVAGKVIARAKMSLRVVAKPVDKTEFSISVEGVQFTDDSAAPGEEVTRHSTIRPSYPKDAIDERTAATVYVLVQVGRDGHVLNAGAEQVNFTLDCPPSSRHGLENQFAHASELAIRKWTFDVPTRGPQAAAPYWYARIPVTYSLTGVGMPRSSEEYGAWQPYIPGPRRSLPWVNDRGVMASAPDATPGDQPVLLGGPLQLVN